jgi:excisionase family DNA binding protein
METLTTKETAERLGVTVPRVHALIKAGRLPAEKRGRDVFIKESDLSLVADRKTGRPPKAKAEDATTKRTTTKATAKKEGKR